MANKFLNILSSNVLINKNSLKINLSNTPLSHNTAYDVIIPNGTILNMAGENCDIGSYKIKTSPLDDNVKLDLPSGRKISRHISDKGIIIEYTVGEEIRKLFVYDYVAKNIAMCDQSNTNRYRNVEAGGGNRANIYNSSLYQQRQYTIFKEYQNLRTSAADTGGNVTLFFMEDPNSYIGLSNISNDNLDSDNKCIYPGKNYTFSEKDNGGASITVSTIPAYLSSEVLCNNWIENFGTTYSSPLINYARSISDISGITSLDIPSWHELYVILTSSNISNPSFLKGDLYTLFVEKNWGSFPLYVLTSNTAIFYSNNNRVSGKTSNAVSLGFFKYNSTNTTYEFCPLLLGGSATPLPYTSTNGYSFLVKRMQ